MKGHVENSIGIIRYLPSLDYVIPAVISHHERWDGRGYPRGIAKEEIPIGGRILCIADSFDAMTSKRSYKEAFTLSYAIEELTRNAGKQFDPELTEVFVNLLRSGEIKIQTEQ
ncbi:HD domain-containing phosphohydrolase [Erysipelotrichaceae bacterium HCN-30851]